MAYNLNTETATGEQLGHFYTPLWCWYLSGHPPRSTSATRARDTTAAAGRAAGPGSLWMGSWRGSGNGGFWLVETDNTDLWLVQEHVGVSGSGHLCLTSWPGHSGCLRVIWPRSVNCPGDDILGRYSPPSRGNITHRGYFVGPRIKIPLLPLTAALRWQLELTGWRTFCTFGGEMSGVLLLLPQTFPCLNVIFLVTSSYVWTCF